MSVEVDSIRQGEGWQGEAGGEGLKGEGFGGRRHGEGWQGGGIARGGVAGVGW